jgi:hypothetical protein
MMQSHTKIDLVTLADLGGSLYLPGCTCPLEYVLCSLDQGHVDHPAIKTEGTFSLFVM